MRVQGVVGAVLLAVGLTTAGLAPADATPASGFAAEGRAAGLSAAQIAAVQIEADGYLADLGGRQVALNRIELEGATITIAVPGGSRLAPDPNCDGGIDPKHFCAYRKPGYTGTNIDMFACGVYDIPESWVGPGSWFNNQTKGTVAEMLNDAGKVIHYTRPAPYGDPNGNWTPVDRVRNC
ncbi:hypothetical protein [Actinosynnema sp. NPDC020468]|uniref:hypothetical protein n=1 Tax=Actinosynnema sp. NPDC020468 TaxID=3154488 RepID=UPI0033FDB4E6